MDTRFKKGQVPWNKGKPAPWAKNNPQIFKKGHVSWKKGKKATEFEKERLRKMATGRKQSPEEKLKRAMKNRGQKRSEEFRKMIRDMKLELVMSGKHNWGDGTRTNWRKKIYNSFEFKKWRRDVFKRDDFTCKVCNTRGGDLQAHHIKPFAYFPDHRFDLKNGVMLCISCHKKTDTYGTKAKKLFGFKSNETTSVNEPTF